MIRVEEYSTHRVMLMGNSVLSDEWSAVMVTDVVDLIRVLVLTYAVVLGVVMGVTAWQKLRARRSDRRQSSNVVPPVGVIAPDADSGMRKQGARCWSGRWTPTPEWRTWSLPRRSRGITGLLGVRRRAATT